MVAWTCFTAGMPPGIPGFQVVRRWGGIGPRSAGAGAAAPTVPHARTPAAATTSTARATLRIGFISASAAGAGYAPKWRRIRSTMRSAARPSP